MAVYKINYGGKNLQGLVESFTGDINYFLKEVEILEAIEQSLSKFISNSVKELNSEAHGGIVWLNRFNASENGQDAFYVEFSPTPKEQEKVRFVQTAIAKGRFLTKEISFFNNCPQLPYIEKEVVPFLKEMFVKFGFKITNL